MIDENLISPYDGKYDNITSDKKEEVSNKNIFKNFGTSNSQFNNDIISIDEKEKNITNIENNENKEEDKPKLNNEIEQLDKEILNLKNKLKNMINK